MTITGIWILKGNSHHPFHSQWRYLRTGNIHLISRPVISYQTNSLEKGSISFTAHYTTPYTENTEYRISSRNELQLNGKANDHEGIEGKVRFTALTRIENNGGTLKATSDSTLQVKNANSVVLYVSIGTNFINYKDVSGDALKTARQYMKQAGKNYAKEKNPTLPPIKNTLTAFPSTWAAIPKSRNRQTGV